jgi:hypothetical protein
MVIFKDHNGTTSFGDHVKLFTYSELEAAFSGKHDIKLLAKALGIKVEKTGEFKPYKSVPAKVEKKKKED